VFALSVRWGSGSSWVRVHERTGLWRRTLTAAHARNPCYSTQVSSVYVHLPFCRRRCYYCDFPVSIVGDKGASRSTAVYDGMATYVDRVCSEIRNQRVSAQSQGDAPTTPLRTVYFGGGTPSLVPPALIERILRALDERFGLYRGAGGTEVTMECDPGTFDRKRLQEYVGLGVNRVSVGVQTFDAALLASLGRAHTLSDVHQALEDIHALGGSGIGGVSIQSFSIDLISGLPGQAMSTWENSVAQAVRCEAPHVSMYDLVVEPRTSFGRWAAKGTLLLPPDSTAAEMYRVGSSILRSEGYDHYEISNYALPGHECAHNQTYWTRSPYYGFGVGAASYVQGRRVERPRTLPAYYAWLEELTADREAENTESMEEEEDALLETLMLSLRTSKGISFHALQAEFGDDLASAVRKSLARFAPHWVHLDDERASLTDPEGMLFSNDVISSAIAECVH